MNNYVLYALGGLITTFLIGLCCSCKLCNDADKEGEKAWAILLNFFFWPVCVIFLVSEAGHWIKTKIGNKNGKK